MSEISVEAQPQVPERTRLSREQVRTRLLDAALAVVRVEGLRVGVGHLPLEDVIRSAGVPRSTVYRIWPTRQSFYNDLIAAVPERVLATRLDQPSLVAGDSYLHRHHVEEPTAEQRRATLVASVRVAVDANVENVFASQHWRNFIALAGAVEAHQEPARTGIRQALRARQLHFIDNMAKYYQHTLEEAGLHLRPGFGHAELASAVSALVEGLCIARIAAPELVTGPVDPDDPDSPSLAVTAVLMLIDGFTEPTP